MAEGVAAAGDADAGLRVRLRQVAPVALDMEFHCAPGELLALLGPSGAGKSTALRCVAGLARPAGGSVACGGEVWFDAEAGTDLPARRRRVGMVFQSYALFPPHERAGERRGGDRPPARGGAGGPGARPAGAGAPRRARRPPPRAVV